MQKAELTCRLLEEICVKPRLAGKYACEPFPCGLRASYPWHHQLPVLFEEIIAKVKLLPSYYPPSQDAATALENCGVTLQKPGPNLYHLRPVGDALKYILVDTEEGHRWITQRQLINVQKARLICGT